MTKQRKMNERSLLNLNPKARFLGKVNITLTLKPETIAWLKAKGNASALVDYLVEFAKTQHKVLMAENQRLKALVVKDKKAYTKEIENAIAEIVARSEVGESGYRSNAFGKGLKALKDLLEGIKAA